MVLFDPDFIQLPRNHNYDCRAQSMAMGMVVGIHINSSTEKEHALHY